MNLKSRYKKLSFWNKVAFWGSIASVLAIVLAILLWIKEYQSEQKKNKNYLPAREAVVTSVFQCYSSLIYATEYAVAPAGKTASQKFLASKWSLDPVEYDIKKLETIVIRNNVALDPQSISLVSAFLDDARSLQKHLTFFAQMNNPEMSSWDFVSRGPFSKLKKLEDVIRKLKIQYPNIKLADNLKSVKELEHIWKNVERTNDRICLKVGEYKWKKDRRPMVFDRNDLVKLGGPTNSDYRIETYVYDLNE